MFRIVYPSAGAFLTASVPFEPEPPTMFCTTTGWPRSLLAISPTTLIETSGDEPAFHDTTVKEKDLGAVLGEEARVLTHNLSQVCPKTEPQRHTVASEMDRRTEHTGGSVEATADSENAAETLEGEYVTGLDNRYVSEDATIKGDKVELTEEQIKVCRASWGVS